MKSFSSLTCFKSAKSKDPPAPEFFISAMASSKDFTSVFGSTPSVISAVFVCILPRSMSSPCQGLSIITLAEALFMRFSASFTASSSFKISSISQYIFSCAASTSFMCDDFTLRLVKISGSLSCPNFDRASSAWVALATLAANSSASFGTLSCVSPMPSDSPKSSGFCSVSSTTPSFISSDISLFLSCSSPRTAILCILTIDTDLRNPFRYHLDSLSFVGLRLFGKLRRRNFGLFQRIFISLIRLILALL